MTRPTPENWAEATRNVTGSVDAARQALNGGAAEAFVRDMDYGATMRLFAEDVPVEDRDEFVAYLAAVCAVAVSRLALAEWQRDNGRAAAGYLRDDETVGTLTCHLPAGTTHSRFTAAREVAEFQWQHLRAAGYRLVWVGDGAA